MTPALVALSLPALLAAVGSGAPAAPRPLYYDHPMARGDLNDRSSEELRLMRNTIYARVGREFKDPDLRDYFAKQPWYRPTATPAKLSPVDEKNLARIDLWEPLQGGLPPHVEGRQTDPRGHLPNRRANVRRLSLRSSARWPIRDSRPALRRAQGHDTQGDLQSQIG